MAHTLSGMDEPPSGALRSFDAFPKTLPTYRERTWRGGLLTVLVGLVIVVLVWHELRAYIFAEATYTFAVDHHMEQRHLAINVDVTVAMPCKYLTVDVRDAVGDRLHISDEFKKDGTTFEIGQAKRLDNRVRSKGDVSASRMLRDAKGGRRGQKFDKTAVVIPDGPACRVYGTMDVKKVTGNLHITTLGHGYLSWQHTDHKLMNLSHVIHEFSFGKFFPNIVQPLDNSAEVTTAPFHIFQYFLNVVPTLYVDSSGRMLHTNQYSVTDMSRETEHGHGVPGIFFKYDLEPLSLTVRERATTLIQFLVRLAGIVGGVVVCSSWTVRVGSWAAKGVKAMVTDEKDSLLSSSALTSTPLNGVGLTQRRFYNGI